MTTKTLIKCVCVLTVMGMNTFITTQGFAKISMLTTVIGAVTNIVLDPVFIFVLDLGVAGAAIATVLHLLDFPMPFLAPPFYKLDLSELPVMLCGFCSFSSSSDCPCDEASR